MIVQSLIDEFEHEVNSTRRLLLAVPEKDLGFRPSPTSWTMGELAQHIATIYYWYVGSLTQDVYDMGADSFERGATDDIRATIELFEKNVEKARVAIRSITEESLAVQWTMKFGDRTLIGPMPRNLVVRGFLFNHLYHHRGELIVYLRATGNKVPGLYGPTYEESTGLG
ncbi:putative damage-inducible protein DinB [Arcticibacter pallidicorallinus]|uniref:Putative damage-inducible protein DinB n=1 Tax=Arcticibacter pallidicorallinus TaxID=1259464 RepID=A0A2T0TX96_9SPHI|nr:DinB family protein [Arcticibacter pallidicorallinus]PRY50289.1 putative damage-inducible protein DinB [Arcticibacter pallidicorallinus]